MRKTLSFLLFTSLLALGGAASAGAPQVGDGDVLATVPPSPGYPEAIVLDRGLVYVSGPATFGTAGQGPSAVQVFRRSTGALLETIAIEGEDLSQEHALSGIAVDASGRLYALSTQLGVVRLARHGGGWTQELYATAFPDRNPADPLPPLPNDLAFDESGDLYVTDSLQATIWRIPAGGGAPQVWFFDPALIITGQAQLGPNGIRVDPAREYLYFTYSGGPAVAPGELAQPGVVYRLPLVDSPTAADLEAVYTFEGFEIPDGIAFTRDGELYVVLALTNAIAALSLDAPATEIARITGPNGSSVPFIQPSNLLFDAGHALVVNHALYAPSLDPNPFAVIEVYVGVQGDRLPRPHVP